MLAAAVVLALALPAAGQGGPAVQEQQRPGEAAEDAADAARMGQEAARLRELGPDERVTYADVLRNPDDVELNYRYAQTQVAEGDLRGAASTLERILLVSPDLARVRLLYAVVLFRLDNLNESEREFRIVSQLPMPESLREEVDDYLDQIALRRRATRFNGSVAMGMQWDSNRNAGPDGDDVLFLDTPFDLVEGQAAADWSGIGIAGLSVEHDLGYDAGHALFGGARVYGQKQINETDLDLMALSGSAGALYRTRFADLRPAVFGNYINLGGDSYVSTVGAGMQAYRRWSERFDSSLLARADYEFFESLPDSPITDQRTGFRYEVGAGSGWNLSPRVRLDASAGWLRKYARVDFYAYEGPFATLSATWVLGQGQFLIGGVAYEHDGYDGPDPFVSPRTRSDNLYRGRVVYGAPLGFLLQFLQLPRAVRDTLLSVSGEYLDVQSNLPNYEYDNWRVSMLFTKSFEF